MQQISKPTRERLMQLIGVLDQLDTTNVVTSSVLEHRTGWSRDTIRRDLSLLPVQCGSPVGYNVQLLKSTIKSTLNISNSEKNCCIVGLGKIGSSLLYFEGFKTSSFVMKAGFDSNVNITEILKSPFPLYPLSKLESIIAQENIEYAILSVEDKEAQKIAQRLSGAGIIGIVNYTSSILNLSEKTRVENISVIDALKKLSIGI